MNLDNQSSNPLDTALRQHFSNQPAPRLHDDATEGLDALLTQHRRSTARRRAVATTVMVGLVVTGLVVGANTLSARKVTVTQAHPATMPTSTAAAGSPAGAGTAHMAPATPVQLGQAWAYGDDPGVRVAYAEAARTTCGSEPIRPIPVRWDGLGRYGTPPDMFPLTTCDTKILTAIFGDQTTAAVAAADALRGAISTARATFVASPTGKEHQTAWNACMSRAVATTMGDWTPGPSVEAGGLKTPHPGPLPPDLQHQLCDGETNYSTSVASQVNNEEVRAITALGQVHNTWVGHLLQAREWARKQQIPAPTASFGMPSPMPTGLMVPLPNATGAPSVTGRPPGGGPDITRSAPAPAPRNADPAQQRALREKAIGLARKYPNDGLNIDSDMTRGVYIVEVAADSPEQLLKDAAALGLAPAGISRDLMMPFAERELFQTMLQSRMRSYVNQPDADTRWGTVRVHGRDQVEFGAKGLGNAMTSESLHQSLTRMVSDEARAFTTDYRQRHFVVPKALQLMVSDPHRIHNMSSIAWMMDALPIGQPQPAIPAVGRS